MSNKSVHFLGEEYIVPSELREFVGYTYFFERIQDEILSSFAKQITKQRNTCANVDQELLTKVGEDVIAKLAQDNIFDVTLDDLVYNNEGYVKLETVMRDTMSEMINISIESLEQLETGYDKAYSEAYSQVNGSGMAVYGDMSSLLAYDLVEQMYVNKQTKAAELEYNAAIDSLNKDVKNAQERKERDLLVNQHYPKMKEALILFVAYMEEYYLDKLEQHDIFMYSQVKKYNPKRSSNLLKNANFVSDKLGLAKEAFVCCPYNIEIYKFVIDNGFIDLPTFETAKYFMLDVALCDYIEMCVKNDWRDSDKIQGAVKILAKLKAESEEEAGKEVFSWICLQARKYYLKIEDTSEKRSALIVWLQNNITNDIKELCGISSEELLNRINETVKSEAMADKQYQTAYDLGVLNNNEFFKNRLLGEINNEYANILFNAVASLIEELNEYQEVKTWMDELQNKRIDLSRERYDLSFFAFKKKCKLNGEIWQCNMDIEILQKSNKAVIKKGEEILSEWKHNMKKV